MMIVSLVSVDKEFGICELNRLAYLGKETKKIANMTKMSCTLLYP